MKTMENGRQSTQHFDLFQPEDTYYSVRGLNQVNVCLLTSSTLINVLCDSIMLASQAEKMKWDNTTLYTKLDTVKNMTVF